MAPNFEAFYRLNLDKLPDARDGICAMARLERLDDAPDLSRNWSKRLKRIGLSKYLCCNGATLYLIFQACRP
jgi:hypothetical protein